MEHLNETLQAAKDFKVIATQLVESLCSLLQVELSDPDRNWLLRKAFGKQKEHSLDNNWTFCLHGAECRFTNRDSEQEIEVILIYGPECGVLDPYFFYKFCEKSIIYKHLSKFYGSDTKKILEDFLILYKKGYLKNVCNSDDNLSRSLST